MLDFEVVPVPGAARREARDFNRQWTLDDPAPLDAEALRAGYWITQVGLPGRGEAVDETLGGVTCRVVRPDRPTGVYLHLHGGGFILGDPRLQDRQLEGIARRTGLLVVSVDYRLAPEHPYPAGLDDAVAVADALLDDPDLARLPVVVGGESAGANLAVGTLLRLRDAGRHRRIVAANLVYGGYTMGSLPSRDAWGDRYLVLSKPLIEFFHRSYAAPADDPYASPLLADTSDLPPALFTVGTEDPLLDDSLLMATRWAAAGSRARLEVWPEAAHAFDAFPIAIGGMVRRRLVDWLAGLTG